MANLSVFASQSMINGILGGGAWPSPTVRAVNVCLTAPTSTNAFEIATGSGMSRQTIGFSAAGSPGATAGNNVAITLGPISAACTVLGVGIWDTLAATIGNNWFFNTLLTARTMNGGDSMVFAVGALAVSII
jgi:hypothetical protein